MKKAFSLIEIIFTLMIISIIVTVAVSKFDLALNSANLNKIKADIIQIRAGINLYKNSLILKDDSSSFTTLDQHNNALFSKVLDSPIQSSSKEWTQTSDTTYNLFIDSENSIEFRFDSTNYTFDCDISDTLCKDLSL
ncbi:MAG: type II secretion system protein [Arcobacteraceae bacterium]